MAAVYTAEPVRAGLQVEAFESIALPEAVVASINLGDVDPGVVGSFSGWRLDFPRPAAARLKGEDLTMVALAQDLLVRGTTPIAFAEIEEAIDGAGDIDWLGLDSRELSKRLISVAGRPPHPHDPGAFDSDEERELVQWIRETIRESGSGWSLQTQVHVASLAPGMPEASRADIVLTHPNGSRVVVELDGAHHQQHTDADRAYSEELSEAGFEVVRVQTMELDLREGPGWDRLEQLLNESLPRTSDTYAGALKAYRFAHQLQVATLKAVMSGHLPLRGRWSIQLEAAHNLPMDVARLAVAQVARLLNQLSRIWAVEPIPEANFSIQPAQPVRSSADDTLAAVFGDSQARYEITDVVLPTRPLHMPAWVTPLVPREELNREDGEWFLQWIFRKESFWEGQWECVERAIRGLDTLVLLPTGRGKSIAFQLAALLRPGPCIVVDPIISLMDDQIDNLRTVGLDRTIGISGRQSAERKDQLLSGFASGHYMFCFVSPERFQSIPFRETLRRLTVNSPVSLIAIDEAHCVSEWGHDFRTAYLNLGRTTREYCAQEGEAPPPLVGLTGTASRVVLKDVQRALGIQGVDAIITPSSFDRPELTFGVVTCRSEEKAARLTGLVQGMPRRFALTQGMFFAQGSSNGSAGLIFCPHVNGSFGMVRVAKHLSEELGLEVETYSGSKPKRFSGDWEHHKIRVARDFKRNRVNLLASTKAFGMGIDKPNIRFTVHFGLPQTVEAFYQEAGRAGRDQEPAHCEIVLSVDQPQRARKLLDPNTPIDEVGQRIAEVSWAEADDVTRALYFHTRSFSGVDSGIEMVRRVLEKLGEIVQDRALTFSWAGIARDRDQDEQQESEKALHHLVILGVVRDYTINWAKREFQVVLGDPGPESIAQALGAYGRAYQVRRGERLQREFETRVPDGPTDRVVFGARLLLEFIYETVELARRRGLSEMLQAATEAAAASGDGSELLKRRVLTYLTETEWDVRLEEIGSAGALATDALRLVAEEVVSTRHAEDLRGATVRQLASYPDQPAFLFLRAFAEACVQEPKWSEITESVRAAIEFGSTKYDLSEEELAVAVAELASYVESRGRDGRPFVQSAGAASSATREFRRALCDRLPPHLAVDLVPLLLLDLRRAAVGDPSELPH